MAIHGFRNEPVEDEKSYQRSVSPNYQGGDVDKLLRQVKKTGKLDLRNINEPVPGLYRTRLFVEEVSVSIDQIENKLKWSNDHQRRDIYESNSSAPHVDAKLNDRVGSFGQRI